MASLSQFSVGGGIGAVFVGVECLWEGCGAFCSFLFLPFSILPPASSGRLRKKKKKNFLFSALGVCRSPPASIAAKKQIQFDGGVRNKYRCYCEKSLLAGNLLSAQREGNKFIATCCDISWWTFYSSRKSFTNTAMIVHTMWCWCRRLAFWSVGIRICSRAARQFLICSNFISTTIRTAEKAR